MELAVKWPEMVVKWPTLRVVSFFVQALLGLFLHTILTEIYKSIDRSLRVEKMVVLIKTVLFSFN